jgi:hypothetical protein
VCLNAGRRPQECYPEASQTPTNTARARVSNRFQPKTDPNHKEIRCDAANFNKFLGAIRGLVLDGGTSPPIEVNHMRGGSQIESPASH